MAAPQGVGQSIADGSVDEWYRVGIQATHQAHLQGLRELLEDARQNSPLGPRPPAERPNLRGALPAAAEERGAALAGQLARIHLGNVRQ